MSNTSRSFWSVIGEQGDEQKTSLNTVGLVVSLVSLVVFVPMSLCFGPWRGSLALFGLGLFATTWFAVMRFAPPRRWLTLLDDTVGLALVGSIPAVIVLGLSIRHSPTLGFGSWTAAQLGIVIIAASGLTFRVVQPMLCSVVAAVSYLVMYWALRGQLPAAAGVDDLWGVRVTVFRVVGFLVWGAVWSGLIWGLRQAVGRAVSTMRARDLFGKYRLGRTIASGGMGSVCRATYCPEGGFAREVAVKRIHPHLAVNPGMAARFRREAELGARLLHPNIVATLDFGRVDDTYFVAMEYVDGASLRELMCRSGARGEPVPERIVAWIGREICRGLEFAHTDAVCAEGKRLRIVHDDICPDNILVSRAGVPKVADFGVARALREETRHVTQHIVGKVGYLAPEQIRGEAFDARVDLFALGCVLWEALSGRRLFRRPQLGETLRAIVDGDVPDIATLRPDVDPRWSRFLSRALATNPQQRFSSAAEMGAALQTMLPSPLADDEMGTWLRPLLAEDAAETQLSPVPPHRDPAPVIAPVDLSGPTLTTPADVLPAWTTIADEEAAWGFAEVARTAA